MSIYIVNEPNQRTQIYTKHEYAKAVIAGFKENTLITYKDISTKTLIGARIFNHKIKIDYLALQTDLDEDKALEVFTWPEQQMV